MPREAVLEAAVLLRRYEPVVRLTRGELFHPSSVEDYLTHAALVAGAGESAEVVAGPGTLDTARLAELGEVHTSEPLSLRYVQSPMGLREYRSWRRTAPSATFRRSSGAAAAGLLARVVAAFMRLSLLLRGKVPGGSTAVAYEQSRAADESGKCHYYGHMLRDAGYVVLQYWFFYPMNDWRSSFGGVNDHEADWEHVSVLLPDDGASTTPAWVVFASHDETGADLRRRWDDPDLEHAGEHPVVYVGAGSHSAACLPGDYLVTVAPELPGWLQRLRRKVGRVIPWWEPESVGIGIPFIDYRRGDGLSIGPGLDREWELPHVVDDTTGWVRHYRGLWGLDTRDPLGGERAPAGPRYERNGAVRPSWGEPITWAQLDGEPATQQEAEELWQGRPTRLKGELAAIAEQLEVSREELREASLADRVAGRSPLDPGNERAALQDRVTTLRRRQAGLEAELDAYRSSRGGALPQPGPHDHLRHRALPLAQDQVSRSRALRVWASASSAIMFAALGLLLLAGGSQLFLPVLGIFAAMLLVEAALRRHLVALVVNVVVAAVVASAVWTVARLMLENVRAGVGVLLLLAAVYMSIQTVADAVVNRQPRRSRRSAG
ncbi:MAG TPA: hypothetical protein VK204_19515 [Nocardioidaceae bacterium]|nr:hypothetical protein [Nocardioidaceae bacterium]